jgi:hypothetical protein
MELPLALTFYLNYLYSGYIIAFGKVIGLRLMAGARIPADSGVAASTALSRRPPPHTHPST